MITPFMNRSTEELIALATGRHWTAFGESLGQGNMPKDESQKGTFYFYGRFGLPRCRREVSSPSFAAVFVSQ